MADTRKQAMADADGFDVTVKDLTTGTYKPYDEGGTTEVGNSYSRDPLGKSAVKTPAGVK